MTARSTCANRVDMLTVRSVFPSNVHINILRGLPCRLESLRLKFTNEPSIVDGDLDESIKRSASDRLGDSMIWCHRFEPGLLQDFSLHGASGPLSRNFSWTKMCLGKAQALLGGLGACFPIKFWKNGAKSCDFMHSGSKHRVIAVWSTHEN